MNKLFAVLFLLFPVTLYASKTNDFNLSTRLTLANSATTISLKKAKRHVECHCEGKELICCEWPSGHCWGGQAIC